jgi:hypothetical protein
MFPFQLFATTGRIAALGSIVGFSLKWFFLATDQKK